MNWLDGKKTTIAAGLLVAAAFLDQVVIGEFHATVEWLPPTAAALEWVGMFVGGAGLTHKAIKAKLANGGTI
jgi:hypothetical protein